MNWTPHNIRKLIDHLGGTDSAFAERVGVTRYAVSNWLSGRRSPSGLAKRSMTELAHKIKYPTKGNA